MISYDFLLDGSILVLRPQGPLEAADFSWLASQLDTYLVDHARLRGVLIHARSFPGWKDFAAMLAQFKFLKIPIKRIGKVAILADGAVADVVPGIANHFVHAQVRHFDFMREDEALDWIGQTDKARFFRIGS